MLRENNMARRKAWVLLAVGPLFFSLLRYLSTYTMGF